MAYLQHRFDRMGLDKMLAKAGCVTGDTVRILGYDLDYKGEDEDDMYAELTEDEPILTVGELFDEFEDEATGGAEAPEDASDASGAVDASDASGVEGCAIAETAREDQ